MIKRTSDPDGIFLAVYQYSTKLYRLRDLLDAAEDKNEVEDEYFLAEIMLLLSEIDDDNERLEEWFCSRPELRAVLRSFSAVVQEAEEMAEEWTGNASRRQLLNTRFYPVFSAWQTAVQLQLKPYTIA